MVNLYYKGERVKTFSTLDIAWSYCREADLTRWAKTSPQSASLKLISSYKLEEIKDD